MGFVERNVAANIDGMGLALVGRSVKILLGMRVGRSADTVPWDFMVEDWAWNPSAKDSVVRCHLEASGCQR